MDVSDAQFAAFIDRIIACRDAEDAAKEDTKRVYAELADLGGDKTAAGLLVRAERMDQKTVIKANLRDAAVEDYRARYLRGKASHVRVRESTTQNTSVPAGFDPETGEEVTTSEITEPARNEAAASRSSASPLAAAPAFKSQPEAAVRLAASDEAATSLDRAESDADGQPIQPETANQSTAARMDVREGSVGETAEGEREPLALLVSVQAPQAGTQARPVDTNSNIVALDTSSGTSADDAGEASSSIPASPATESQERPGVDLADPLRSGAATRKDADTGALGPIFWHEFADPRCQQPDLCGPESDVLCARCRGDQVEPRQFEAAE